MKEFEWYHSCFNTSAYSIALQSLYAASTSGSEIEKDLQARFVTMATSFAIARSAIIKLSSQSLIELNLPIEPADRLELSKKWLDMSVACLKCAGPFFFFFFFLSVVRLSKLCQSVNSLVRGELMLGLLVII
jgi:hypothetical protein